MHNRTRPWGLRKAAAFGGSALMALALGVGVGSAGGVAGWSGAPDAADSASFDAGPRQENAVAPLMLPVLNFQGRIDICRSWVGVLNAGDRDTKAILVAWGEASPAGGCRGPLKAECSGLIAPGTSWHFLGAQIPSGSAGAFVYSFDPRPLTSLGVTGLGDDLAADYLCETIFFGLTGDCADASAFHEAYLSGGMFKEVPMNLVKGGPLAATVLRHCPGDASPGAEVSSTYQAAPLVPAAMAQVSGGGYSATVFPMSRREAGVPGGGARGPRGPFVYAQSAAAELTTVRFAVRAAGGANAWVDCGEVQMFLGESTQKDMSGCVNPGVDYAIRVTSAGPVAVVAEQAEDDTLATVEGFYPGGPLDASGRLVPGLANKVFGPLFRVGAGWTSTVAVRVPGAAPADVTVSRFVEGVPVQAETRRVCADCLATFLLESTGAFTEGSVQVEGAAVGDVGAPRVDAALLSRNAGGSPNEGGFAYAMVPTSLIEAAGAGGALGVPITVRDTHNTGTTSELVLARPSGAGEPVQAASHFFAVNDVVDVECQSIAPGAQAHWVAQNSALRDGFLGGAMVRVDNAGAEPVGAASLLFTGTEGDPIQGDEMSASLAAGLLTLPAYTDWPQDPCASFAPPERPDPPAPADRATSIRSALHLPVIAFQGQDDVCAATAMVTNNGDMPMIAILATWGEPGFCPPQCAGPQFLTCSGLLGPGQMWHLGPTPGSLSGIVLGVKGLTMDEAGAVPGGPELAADVLCDGLFFYAVGDCNGWRRFALAWAGGDSFATENRTIPLGVLATDEFTVDVVRRCPGPVTPGVEVMNSYQALSADRFDPLGDAPGRWIQSATPVEASNQARTVIYIQNAGPRCTSVVLTWHLDGDWDDAVHCDIFTLAPGESWQFDAADCRGPDWRGSVVLESTEPLAIIGEIVTAGNARIIDTRARANPYDLNGDAAVDAADVLAVDEALGSAPGHEKWNPLADLDANDLVNHTDRRILAGNLDKGVVPPPEPTEAPSPTPADFGYTVYLPSVTTPGE